MIAGYAEGVNPQMPVDQEVQDLIRLIRDAIHPSYPLIQTLKYGIGVHYGDMPDITRREQERLFDEGKLKFLVCTSTLLEGVNLPCKNLFVWGPRQGKNNPMTEHAFWNLAGRAGRWGREFAGNIYCIDVFDEDKWTFGPPKRRKAQQVNHSGSFLLEDVNKFIEFVYADDQITASNNNRYFEQILGELTGIMIDGGELSQVGWVKWASVEQIEAITDAIQFVITRLTAPSELIKRHRGINPLLISGCYSYLLSLPADQADSMMPMAPDMPNARDVLSSNLAIIDMHLGGGFGTDRQRNFKSRVTIDWIRGLPLGRIINNRLDYLRSVNKLKSIPLEIRCLIEIINKNARYLVPKYLSCYSDCVRLWYISIGRDDLVLEVSDLQDMLEAGVSNRTTIALVGLGLSRFSAIEIANHIANSELNISEVIGWLQGRSLEIYGISPVVIREVQKALRSTNFL